MLDIAYECEASICVAEKFWHGPIPRYDILCAFEKLRYIEALRYWSIMYGTHGV